MADSLATLALLIGLELVLGVDNILVITIFVAQLPDELRNRARLMGLALALVARIGMLFILLALSNLTEPILLGLSVRDLILISGGLFLLWKAVHEIHNTIELKEGGREVARDAIKGVAIIIGQIVLLDIVFSVDSVVTAIGLTSEVWIIVVAVTASFVVILAFAKPIGEFILQRPSLKILALSFLITIGVTIFMEGLHQDVPKAFIYLPMGFALFVELLKLRYDHNRQQRVPGA